MSCIVAIQDKGTVYMGGDSAGADSEFNLTIRADEKVFIVGEFAIGFTTSFRMGQLLRYRMTPPEIPSGMGLSRYMATLFVDQVRATLSLGGWAQKDKEREGGGTFLVGVRGRIFKIYGDYQVEESVFAFNACGCGERVALGSLFTSEPVVVLTPEDRIKRALGAAERFSAGVRAPFIIKSTGGSDERELLQLAALERAGNCNS